MKLLFYDMETTGLDIEKHGVLQISGRVVIDGAIIEAFDFKVAPHDGAEYDPDALAVGNVTKEAVEAYSPMAEVCLLYTSPSPRDGLLSRMPSSA